MSFIFDTANSVFNYFRLGSSVEEPGMIHYCDLSKEKGATEGRRIHQSTLATRSGQCLRICVVSDTHERHYLLDVPPCDMLVYAGDIFMRGRFTSTSSAKNTLTEFNEWLGKQPAQFKLVIGGNHDCVLEKLGAQSAAELFTNAQYLCNTTVEVMGLRVFGTPLSNGASGNSAFQSFEFLQQADGCVKDLVGSGNPVDILITHGTCGTLAESLQPRIMHIHGHIHAMHGVHLRGSKRTGHYWYQVAAPIMDRHYVPSQPPVVVDIPRPRSTDEDL